MPKRVPGIVVVVVVVKEIPVGRGRNERRRNKSELDVDCWRRKSERETDAWNVASPNSACCACLGLLCPRVDRTLGSVGQAAPSDGRSG